MDTLSETEAPKDTSSERKDLNVILIGTMACGKSTVGWRLAKMLGFGFVDLDDWIEKKSGKRVHEIFDEGGELAFRDLERDALADLAPIRNHVISVGGGTVMDTENWQKIRKFGRVVWINTPASEIARRLVMKPDEINSRPLIREAINAGSKDERFKFLHDRIEEILKERESRYSEADIEIVESYSTPQSAATLIKGELAMN